jgi:hypothetical protein
MLDKFMHSSALCPRVPTCAGRGREDSVGRDHVPFHESFDLLFRHELASHRKDLVSSVGLRHSPALALADDGFHFLFLDLLRHIPLLEGGLVLSLTDIQS